VAYLAYAFNVAGYQICMGAIEEYGPVLHAFSPLFQLSSYRSELSQKRDYDSLCDGCYSLAGHTLNSRLYCNLCLVSVLEWMGMLLKMV